MKKAKKGKNISIVLMLMMVLQLMMPVNFAYAADRTDVGDRIDTSRTESEVSIEGATADEHGNFQNVPLEAEVTLEYKFYFLNEEDDDNPYNYFEGDYFSLSFPSPISFNVPNDGYELMFNGVVIGILTLDKTNAKITFTDKVEGQSNIEVHFQIKGTIKGEGGNEGEPVIIDVGYGGKIIEINVLPPEPDPVELDVEKDAAVLLDTEEIEWTIKVTPKDGKVATGVVLTDTFSNNQKYVEGSFEVVTGTAITGSAVTGSGLTVGENEFTYVFPGPIEGTQELKYRTSIADTYLSENTNKPSIIYTNTVYASIGDDKTDPVTKTVEFNWINKTANSQLADDGKKIKWTVTVKNDYDFFNGKTGLRIVDTIGANHDFYSGDDFPVKIKIDGVNEVTVSSGGGSGEYSVAGKTLTYNFADTNFDVAVLTYYTEINNPGANTNDTQYYKNNAKIAWESNEDGPSHQGSKGVGMGIIDKRSSGVTNVNGKSDMEITWTVDINKNRVSITDAVFKDEIPEGLTYKHGSFKVGNSVVSPTAITVNNGKTSITHNLGSITDPVTVTYVTTVDKDYKELFTNTDVKFTNNVELSGIGLSKTQGDKATQTLKSEVINKSVFVKYDYNTRRVTWKIVVNKNEIPLNGVIVKDEIPLGMKFLPETFKVDGISVTSGSALTSTIRGENNITEKDSFEYVLGNISDKHEITFETEVKEAYLAKPENLNKKLVFKNNASVIADGRSEVKVDADETVDNFVVQKNGERIGYESVKWAVPINPNKVSLNGKIVLTDNLQEGLSLDVDSVKLYKLTVSNAGTQDKGEEIDWKSNESDYKHEYDEESREFTFEFTNGLNEAYLLEFVTDVTVNKIKIKNTINLKGTLEDVTSDSEEMTVDINNWSGGGSASNGFLKIIKVDSENEELVLMGAKFKVSDKLEKPYPVTGNDGGIIYGNLPFRWYYIEEIEAPEGYLIDKTIRQVKLNSEEGITLKIPNKKALTDIEFIKHDSEGEPIQGVKFVLKKNNDLEWEPVEAESTAEGKVVFKDIAPGTYIIEELAQPKEYKPLNKVINVVVRINGEGTDMEVLFDGELYSENPFIITNEFVDVEADVELKKTDGYNNMLQGAKFTLYKYKEGAAGNAVGEPAISQADGSVIFTDIPLGTYVVIETEAPYGYAKSDLEVFVNVFRNPAKLDEALVEYSFENDAEFASEPLTVENQKLFADIAFTKVDEGGKTGLAGAKFKLTKDGDSNWGPKFAESDASGKVIFEHIELGEYTIEETESPIGYVKLTDKIHVTIDYNEDKTAAVVTFTINDEGMQLEDGKVYVGNELVDVYADAKLIKNGAAENTKGETLYTKVLKDAKFDIYQLGEDGEESHIGSSTSEEDGSVAFSKLPLGKYVIREAEAPSGYLKTNEEVFVKVYRNPDKLDEALISYWIEGQEPGGEKITVINNSINIELKKTDTSGNPLAGAEFTLYDSDENEVEGFEPVTSNEFGEVIFTAVPEGSYIIKETKAPNGYRDYNKKITAKISVVDNEAVIEFLIDGEEAVLEDGMLTVENERRPGGGTPVYGKIAIKKVDEDKKVLEGAEFTLYDSTGKVAGKAVSGKDGIASFENLEKGNYIIKETKAPDGYVLEVNETEVTIKGSETKTYTFTNKKEEPKKPGRIEIIKTDEEGNLLSDAWFSLIDEKGSTLQNVVTVNGIAVFEDVPAGRYTVKEVQAPAGYELSGKTVSVTVGGEETITVNFVNKLSGVPVVPVNGKITINKVDENNMALSGAEFTLYNENNEVLGTAVSDENGRVMFENLKDGKYFVKETKAPEGYEIVTDGLNVDIAQGKSYSYRLKNVPSSEIIRDPNVPKGWETIEDPGVPADTAPTLPDTGSFLNTWILAAIGFMFILTGIILYGRRMLRN